MKKNLLLKRNPLKTFKRSCQSKVLRISYQEDLYIPLEATTTQF